MKIQYHIDDFRKKELESLMEDFKIPTGQSLITASLDLFIWALREKQKGRSIVTRDEKLKRVEKEYLLPYINSK